MEDFLLNTKLVGQAFFRQEVGCLRQAVREEQVLPCRGFVTGCDFPEESGAGRFDFMTQLNRVGPLALVGIVVVVATGSEKVGVCREIDVGLSKDAGESILKAGLLIEWAGRERSPLEGVLVGTATEGQGDFIGRVIIEDSLPFASVLHEAVVIEERSLQCGKFVDCVAVESREIPVITNDSESGREKP